MDAVKEFFGDPIFVYTEQEALSDGVLMKNPSTEFNECDIITTNLWSYIEAASKELLVTEPIELLNCIMKQAKRIYLRAKFQGDHDRNFFVIKNKNKFKAVWFVRNDQGKLTAMLPSDY